MVHLKKTIDVIQTLMKHALGSGYNNFSRSHDCLLRSFSKSPKQFRREAQLLLPLIRTHLKLQMTLKGMKKRVVDYMIDGCDFK